MPVSEHGLSKRARNALIFGSTHRIFAYVSAHVRTASRTQQSIAPALVCGLASSRTERSLLSLLPAAFPRFIVLLDYISETIMFH